MSSLQKRGSRAMQYYVYILTNKRNGTLYIGVTSDLLKRVAEHKSKEIEGFTKKYSIDKLVYYETTDDIQVALQREKNLKHWKRGWKLELIEKINPRWIDLYHELVSGSSLSQG